MMIMRPRSPRLRMRLLAVALPLAVVAAWTVARADEAPAGGRLPGDHVVPRQQSPEDVQRKSAGCLTCHTATDAPSMHATAQPIGCADCHGGDPTVRVDGAPGSAAYVAATDRAHVLPRDRELWRNSANPERTYAKALQEDLAFVRFVNPGDLRAAPFACGGCHDTDQNPIVHHVTRSPMTTGAMLYAAALYNNGVLPGRDPIVGESYDSQGRPQVLKQLPPPSADEIRDRALVGALVPFPRWELSRPGNIYRVFERGGRRRLEVGLPNREEEPGRPDRGLSERGFGTFNRTDPVLIGAQKTRLLDPLLSLFGTNDHPGDYRASGCSACHVVYANDREGANSGPWAQHGNRGRSASVDPTIPKDRSGHPVKHAFTRAIPSSQCMSCHMHPGTNMVATYLGYTWWDNESDAALMYPKQPRRLSDADAAAIEDANPEGAAKKGLWSDPEFLAELWRDVNPKAQVTQFGDFHSHGWVFRKVFARDREGRLLDREGQVVPDAAPDRFQRAVHLLDIHTEKGMHCVDCHFEQDSHGDGNLYAEPRAAIEIDCIDCHGTVQARARVFDEKPSGPAATSKSKPLGELVTPFGRQPRFDEIEKDGRKVLVQRSMVTPGLQWELPQVRDTVTPGHPRYSEAARLAKTILRDGLTWGDGNAERAQLAHANDKITCYACHSAWTTSCFGCHLAQKANEKKDNLHSEGGESRNWTSYNFQTLRDDAYFLAKQGPVVSREGGLEIRDRVAPARSACSILVSSQNQNREWIYWQQQTVSSGGYSGTAFSPYVPHTVRGKETKRCTDCHVAASGDNNAWMASLLLHGTGLMNWIGRYAWVALEDHGFEGVVVAERDEPQAVIGSDFHAVVYPDQHAAHVKRGRALTEAYHHGGRVDQVQAFGEYLFAAQGRKGVRAYDIAAIDNKGFSERIVTAPVSPLGQRLYVKTKDAAMVALASTQTIDALRPQLPDNLERPVHPLYAYAYVADRVEGLVVIGPLRTLLDGDPRNNFISRQATFDGGGALLGLRHLTLAGTVAYGLTPRGLVVLDLDQPLQPRLVAELPLREPRAIAVQFRYAFVVDAEGLKVLDVTDPLAPRLVPGAVVPFADARSVYVARTYAYVAAGREGIGIVDVGRPEAPQLVERFDADGQMDDVHDVKLGITNGSVFAYVADGRHGLRVVQLVSANHTPGAYGFSPRPTPKLVATYHTHGNAVSISRGLDRDRAVDETGHQTAVFGRKGSRPLDLAEQRRMYLRDGKLFTVTDTPPGPPKAAATPAGSGGR